MYGCIDKHTADARFDLHRKGLLAPNETVRFVADNCAVVEKNTGRNTVYRAVNIHSYASKHLFHVTSPIQSDKYDHVAEMILQSNVDYLPEGAVRLNTEKRAAQLLRRIFTELLPENGFTLRESQMELSLSMLGAMEQRKVELSEAEVGTGKTHAYLLAAIVHGLFSEEHSPVIISTSTIALQTAICEAYLPQISRLLLAARIIEKPLSWALRKGKSHYVCDRRLSDYLLSVSGWKELTFHDVAMLSVLADKTNRDIDLSHYQISLAVKNRIQVKQPCNGCPLREECRYMELCGKAISGNHDFIVTNHNYIFADVLAGKEGRRALLPMHSTIIIDEAHKLPEVARDMYGRQLYQSEIGNLLTYIAPEKLRKAVQREGLQLFTAEILRENKLLFDNLKKCIQASTEQEQTRFPADLTTGNQMHLLNLRNLLLDLPDHCFHMGDDVLKRKWKHIRRASEDIVKKLDDFLLKKDAICWVERLDDGCSLCSVPKELQALLYHDLWEKDSAYILTSGTLSTPGSGGFSHIRRVTGLDRLSPARIAETKTASPFNYRENALLYLPEMPYPKKEGTGYPKALAAEIVRLVRASNGHALILFTSYQQMKRVYGLAAPHLSGFPLFLMGRGSLDALTKFRSSGNGVLFASDTCGEGLDIAGDALSLLVIVKLPFPVPDPVTDYEKSLYPNLREYLDASAIPDMLIKLKQYAGRLVRSETDTGAIAILDSRAGFHGRYHKPVTQALFDTAVTDRLYHVEAFLRNRKEDGYFTIKTGRIER